DRAGTLSPARAAPDRTDVPAAAFGLVAASLSSFERLEEDCGLGREVGPFGAGDQPAPSPRVTPTRLFGVEAGACDGPPASSAEADSLSRHQPRPLIPAGMAASRCS